MLKHEPIVIEGTDHLTFLEASVYAAQQAVEKKLPCVTFTYALTNPKPGQRTGSGNLVNLNIVKNIRSNNRKLIYAAVPGKQNVFYLTRTH